MTAKEYSNRPEESLRSGGVFMSATPAVAPPVPAADTPAHASAVQASAAGGQGAAGSVPAASTAVIAFEGFTLIGEGKLPEVAGRVKAVVDRGEKAPVLIFDALTSEPIELDMSGTLQEVLSRLPAPAAQDPQGLADKVSADWNAAAATPASPVAVARRGPGRPRLGVVAREVTLLPRHWEWLSRQTGGASVALRKLVEAARNSTEVSDRIRIAQEAAWRFMQAIGGNLAGYDEASRALFAGESQAFDAQVAQWPADVREHAQRLATTAFNLKQQQ